MPPVRGSSTGRPIMALLDLLGRRWTLRVLWELRDGEPVAFGALRARADDVSTSVLTQRLTELREAALVDRDDDGAYALTPLGRRLLEDLAPLNAFAGAWGRRGRADDDL